ncbi:MAG TPA: hypothetical protein VMA09_02210 [Candidatus Binataceae bacterium]|nr:hypothetical protein [Candidatus Binataceae bacterium]
MTPARKILAMASIVAVALAAGCATQSSNQAGQGGAAAPATSTGVETIEYYPSLVKGYQNSYPRRTITILTPTIAADIGNVPPAEAPPLNGNPMIGQLVDQYGNVTERLYAGPLAVTVQNAIARSAEEAGMVASASGDSVYRAGTMQNQDYVLASQIKRCWVRKSKAPDGHAGVWHSEADFELDVTIYKPPFSVEFWKGTSEDTYYDPPVGSFALGPEDEAGVYDFPGQVLSVALTRGVAGIFEKQDLRNLILEDDIHQH